MGNHPVYDKPVPRYGSEPGGVAMRGYDGPLLVCDIDDTLRHTAWWIVLGPGFPQRRIRGARATVARIARRGVPVVYLSAAPARWLRAANERFLRDFPRGILIDRTRMRWRDYLPWGQTARQGAFKRAVLRRLTAAHPGARLLCLGDDRFGDPRAYTGTCDRIFVRRAAGSDRNVPPGFSGVRFDRYGQAPRPPRVLGGEGEGRATHSRECRIYRSPVPGPDDRTRDAILRGVPRRPRASDRRRRPSLVGVPGWPGVVVGH